MGNWFDLNRKLTEIFKKRSDVTTCTISMNMKIKLPTFPDNFADLPPKELYEFWKRYGRSQQGKVQEEGLPDDPCPRCGYLWLSTSWIYKLFGKEDPFLPCCMAHDIEYGLKRKPRKQVDAEFNNCTMLRAGDNLWLQRQSRIYSRVVRIVGPFVW